MRKIILFVIISAVLSFSACRPVDENVPAETYNVTVSESKAADGAEAVSLRETTSPVQENIVTEKEATPAEEILAEMSLEEKVGQVILARYGKTDGEFCFGGYTLYAEDFEGETPETLAEKLKNIREGAKIPPFIAADEEGGYVVRISCNPAFAETPLPSVRKALADGMSMEELTADMAEVLRKAGVNLNLAPVADVAGSSSDYIYKRTCGLGYEETAEVIAEIVLNMRKQGIMCCLKHFPGYGSNTDTHTGIAVDRRDRADFESKDFLPFKAGIEAGAPFVMVNHNIVEAYNGEMPASLAPEVHEALRGLGFEGIVITDDLGMDAIALYTGNPYVTAFLAGNDMLCATDGEECCKALLTAAESGVITRERLDESVLRIIEAKLEYGVIQ